MKENGIFRALLHFLQKLEIAGSCFARVSSLFFNCHLYHVKDIAINILQILQVCIG